MDDSNAALMNAVKQKNEAKIHLKQKMSEFMNQHNELKLKNQGIIELEANIEDLNGGNGSLLQQKQLNETLDELRTDTTKMNTKITSKRPNYTNDKNYNISNKNGDRDALSIFLNRARTTPTTKRTSQINFIRYTDPTETYTQLQEAKYEANTGHANQRYNNIRCKYYKMNEIENEVKNKNKNAMNNEIKDQINDIKNQTSKIENENEIKNANKTITSDVPNHTNGKKYTRNIGNHYRNPLHRFLNRARPTKIALHTLDKSLPIHKSKKCDINKTRDKHYNSLQQESNTIDNANKTKIKPQIEDESTFSENKIHNINVVNMNDVQIQQERQSVKLQNPKLKQKLENQVHRIEDLQSKRNHITQTVNEWKLKYDEINDKSELESAHPVNGLNKLYDIRATCDDETNINQLIQNKQQIILELQTPFNATKCDNLNVILMDKNTTLQNKSDEFQTETTKTIKLLNAEIEKLQNEICTNQKRYENDMTKYQCDKSQLNRIRKNEINNKNKSIYALQNEVIKLKQSVSQPIQSFNGSLIKNERRSISKLTTIEKEYNEKCYTLNNNLIKTNQHKNKNEYNYKKFKEYVDAIVILNTYIKLMHIYSWCSLLLYVWCIRSLFTSALITYTTNTDENGINILKMKNNNKNNNETNYIANHNDDIGFDFDTKQKSLNMYGTSRSKNTQAGERDKTYMIVILSKQLILNSSSDTSNNNSECLISNDQFNVRLNEKNEPINEANELHNKLCGITNELNQHTILVTQCVNNKQINHEVNPITMANMEATRSNTIIETMAYNNEDADQSENANKPVLPPIVQNAHAHNLDDEKNNTINNNFRVPTSNPTQHIQLQTRQHIEINSITESMQQIFTNSNDINIETMIAAINIINKLNNNEQHHKTLLQIQSLNESVKEHKEAGDAFNTTLMEMNANKNRIGKEYCIMKCKYDNNNNSKNNLEQIKAQTSKVFEQCNNEQTKLKQEIIKLNVLSELQNQSGMAQQITQLQHELPKWKNVKQENKLQIKNQALNEQVNEQTQTTKSKHNCLDESNSKDVDINIQNIQSVVNDIESSNTQLEKEHKETTASLAGSPTDTSTTEPINSDNNYDGALAKEYLRDEELRNHMQKTQLIELEESKNNLSKRKEIIQNELSLLKRVKDESLDYNEELVKQITNLQSIQIKQQQKISTQQEISEVQTLYQNAQSQLEIKESLNQQFHNEKQQIIQLFVVTNKISNNNNNNESIESSTFDNKEIKEMQTLEICTSNTFEALDIKQEIECLLNNYQKLTDKNDELQRNIERNKKEHSMETDLDEKNEKFEEIKRLLIEQRRSTEIKQVLSEANNNNDNNESSSSPTQAISKQKNNGSANYNHNNNNNQPYLSSSANISSVHYHCIHYLHKATIK